MKPALEVGVDHAGGLGRGPPAVDRPGPRLLRPGGEVGLQAEGVRSRPGRAGRGPTRPARSAASSSAASSASSSTSSDSILASRKTASAGATSAAQPVLAAPRRRQLVGVDVEHVDERLRGEQRQLAQSAPGRCPAPPRIQRCAPSRGPPARLARPSSIAASAFLPLTSFSSRGTALLERLQVGEHQLGVDRLDVARGSTLAVDVHDVGVVEGADHLADRVGLADVGEELVAQPLALAGAADDARRCRRTTRSPARSARCRRPRRARQPRVGQRRPRRRWARSSRTGSSRRARRSWSAR